MSGRATPERAHGASHLSPAFATPARLQFNRCESAIVAQQPSSFAANR